MEQPKNKKNTKTKKTELKSCVSQIVEASLLYSFSFASVVVLFHSLVLNLIYDEVSD